MGGAACMIMYCQQFNLMHRFRSFNTGVSMKLAVACAPVRRVQRNDEYSARDYEVSK